MSIRSLLADNNLFNLGCHICIIISNKGSVVNIILLKIFHFLLGDFPLNLLTYQIDLFYWVSFVVQVSSSKFLPFKFLLRFPAVYVNC